MVAAWWRLVVATYGGLHRGYSSSRPAGVGLRRIPGTLLHDIAAGLSKYSRDRGSGGEGFLMGRASRAKKVRRMLPGILAEIEAGTKIYVGDPADGVVEPTLTAEWQRICAEGIAEARLRGEAWAKPKAEGGSFSPRSKP